MVERLYVPAEYLCHNRVAKWKDFVLRQSNSMSRHNWPDLEDFLARLSIFMSRQSWPRQVDIMS